MDTIEASLDELVGDQLQPVSYKWLARHFDVPFDISKQILFHFLSKNGQKVKATFLISGWTNQDVSSHVVRLVSADSLENAKSQLSVVTALHVYSVQPSISKDTNALYSTEFSQSEELFRGMVGPDSSKGEGNALGCLLSSVRCNSKRCAAPQIVPPPSAEIAPAARPKSTSTVLANSKLKATQATAPLVQAHSENVEVKNDAEKKNSVPSIKSLPAGGANKKSASKTKRAIVDSESEEETNNEKASQKPTAAQPKKAKQNAVKTSGTSSKPFKEIREIPAAEKPEEIEDTEDLEVPKEHARHKSGSVGVRMEKHAGKLKRRVMKTYFNDAGEEVTEMLEETDDEESEPLRTTDDNQDSKPEVKVPSAPSGGSKPSGGDGSKKGSKAVSAGQRSIAAFFGKKK